MKREITVKMLKRPHFIEANKLRPGDRIRVCDYDENNGSYVRNIEGIITADTEYGSDDDDYFIEWDDGVHRGHVHDYDDDEAILLIGRVESVHRPGVRR